MTFFAMISLLIKKYDSFLVLIYFVSMSTQIISSSDIPKRISKYSKTLYRIMILFLIISNFSPRCEISFYMCFELYTVRERVKCLDMTLL